MSFIPKYIKQQVNNSPRSVVTSDHWNELWNLLITQGDYNSETLDALINGPGAESIGATAVGDGTATTVQGILEELDADVTALDGAAVHKTGNETIEDTKTFTDSPIVPMPTADTNPATKKYVDDKDAAVVHKTGNETIAGEKTFQFPPWVSFQPTYGGQVACKDYVDDLANARYTKTNMQTSGQALLHWDNLTNVPNLADDHWKTPVATKSALPVTGNSLGDNRVVLDDGDGKQAVYTCVATTGTYADQWDKVGDVDWMTEEATRQTQEAARQTAEGASSPRSGRIGQALDFADAEAARVLAEGTADPRTGRVGAELDRVDAELARVAAEGDATKGRVKAENDRVAAEGDATKGRVKAENDRVIAEGDREIAEGDRVIAEQGRVIAEGDATKGRVKAELDREEAEGLRTSAEAARVNAEGNSTKGRVKAENDRVSAEDDRQSAEIIREQNEELRNSPDSENIMLIVDYNGEDGFKSIQEAVNSIPFKSKDNYTIMVFADEPSTVNNPIIIEKGADVKIYLAGMTDNDENQLTNRGFYVDGIKKFKLTGFDIDCYEACSINAEEIEITNCAFILSANHGVWENALEILNCNYADISRCSFEGNANQNNAPILCSNSYVGLGFCTFKNFNIELLRLFMGSTVLAWANTYINIGLPENQYVIKDGTSIFNSDILSTADIADDLTTDDPAKVLSANQGKILKDNADALTDLVSTNVGDLETLITTDKSSLVNATNEVKNLVDTITSDVVLLKKTSGINITKDSLICWIEGSGKTNNDVDRETIVDLSGNNNNAVLTNFNWTKDSGYIGTKLIGDNVDDLARVNIGSYLTKEKEYTLEVTFEQLTSISPYTLFLGTSTHSGRGIAFRVSSAYKTFTLRNGSLWFSGFVDIGVPKNQFSSVIGKHHVVVTFGLTEWKFYYKGSLVNTYTFSKQNDYGDVTLFNNSGAEGVRKLMSFRAYSRVLTADEVAYNWEIERERWGIAND